MMIYRLQKLGQNVSCEIPKWIQKLILSLESRLEAPFHETSPFIFVKYPICSMHGNFITIYPNNHPSVWTYTYILYIIYIHMHLYIYTYIHICIHIYILYIYISAPWSIVAPKRTSRRPGWRSFEKPPWRWVSPCFIYFFGSYPLVIKHIY